MKALTAKNTQCFNPNGLEYVYSIMQAALHKHFAISLNIFPPKANSGFKIQDILMLNFMNQDVSNVSNIYNNIFIRIQVSFCFA